MSQTTGGIAMPLTNSHAVEFVLDHCHKQWISTLVQSLPRGSHQLPGRHHRRATGTRRPCTVLRAMFTKTAFRTQSCIDNRVGSPTATRARTLHIANTDTVKYFGLHPVIPGRLALNYVESTDADHIHTPPRIATDADADHMLRMFLDNKIQSLRVVLMAVDDIVGV